MLSSSLAWHSCLACSACPVSHLDPSSSIVKASALNATTRGQRRWRHFFFDLLRHTSSRAVTAHVLRTETDHVLVCRRPASDDAGIAGTTKAQLLLSESRSLHYFCAGSVDRPRRAALPAKMFCLLPLTAAVVFFIPLVAAQYGSSNYTVDLGYAKYKGVLNQR